jgi:outer membrane receptor protein involved in Fe transport
MKSGDIRMSFLGKATFILFAIGLMSRSFAGTTGALAGKVTDVSTGEALPGVNIVIVGSGRGGVTNSKGEFSITGVTPGKYLVRASLIGYKTIEAKNIEIEADQSTIFNFKLASTEIEVEGVTAYGERPIVDTRKLSGDQTFSRDKIEQLPNLKGVEDVLTLQAGVVKFGNQLFLRGGRANETQILIDGVPTNNVGGGGVTAGTNSTNEQLQQLYAGTATTGGGALSVSANAIQSVSVSSSGLDAEFGNAQSGVVNITTKAGGDKYSGSGQYRTDGISAGGGFGERYYSGFFGGPEPITSYLLPELGVEIPGKLTFFMSADFSQKDGPYDFNRSQFYNPLKRKIKFGGILGFLDNLGFTYTDKQTNNYSFNTKFSYQIGDNDQFSYSYRANVGSSHQLYGAYSWLNLADSTGNRLKLSTQNVGQWTHIIGTNTLLKSYISRQETDEEYTIGDLTPAQYSTVTDIKKRDPSADGFNDLGTGQSWSHANSVVWNAKVDYSSQVHDLHYLKTGIEYFYETLQSTDISFPLAPIAERRLVDSLGGRRGLYPGYGSGRWVTNVTPSRGGLYIQDNIEFGEGLLSIHVGLRYDWFYLGNQVFDTGPLGFVTRWEKVTQLKANDKEAGFGWVNHKSFFSQFVRGNFSPRLAIGYPVSQTTKFYFNYGHFLQYPERDQLYHDPIYTELSGNYVGNPSLKPQRTVQYEAGFEQAIFDDLAIAIRGFYKDIFDYVAPRELPVSPKVNLYINLDYASARGFEVILNKALTHHYSGSIGYTFQIAKGRSSNPFAALNSPQLQGLPRETRLDYDQQHTLNLFLGYRVAPGEDYEIFGLPFDNWGASLTWNFGSGFPYTPYNQGRSLEDVYLLNTGNGPYTSEVNLSFFKGFNVVGKLNLVLTFDVINLFNRKNVDLNAGGFNTLTGRVIRFGDYAPDTRLIYSWAGVQGGQSFASRVSPFVFRSPRQLSLGLKITWD